MDGSRYHLFQYRESGIEEEAAVLAQDVSVLFRYSSVGDETTVDSDRSYVSRRRWRTKVRG